MNYKELFTRTITLLSTPQKAWEEIREETDGALLGAFVYPMIGFCGLTMFVGMLFGNGVEDFNFQLVMTKCCDVFISLFGGFFLSSYFVNYYGIRVLGRNAEEMGMCQKLVGYSMSVLFVLNILSGLFPTFFVLRWILQFYTIYVVWEGAKELMGVSEKHLLTYTVVCSAIILVSPALIGFLFNWLGKMVN